MTDDLSPELIKLFEEDTDGLFDAPAPPRRLTSEDRLERAFLEILEFHDTHHRAPSPDTMDIAERRLGARLVGIMASEEKKALAHLDDAGLLAEPTAPETLDDLLAPGDGVDDILDDDGDAATGLYDTATLPHGGRRAADGVARRTTAPDFADFAPLFRAKQQELRDGTVAPATFTGESTIAEGKFYLWCGMLAFIAEVKPPGDDAPLDSKGRPKERLRVIFDNGTESSMYRASWAIRLYEDGGAVLARTGQIDAADIGDADIESGHIYVLRSLSTNPEIAGLSDLYKIGFTTTSVEKRIRGAEHSPTYLNAPVEVVATYRLYDLRPSAVEHLLHRVFAATRLDITIPGDTGGQGATEWFIAPLKVIDQAIAMIASGDITGYVYEPQMGTLRHVGPAA